MSLLIHRTAKQLNRNRDGCIRKFENFDSYSTQVKFLYSRNMFSPSGDSISTQSIEKKIRSVVLPSGNRGVSYILDYEMMILQYQKVELTDLPIWSDLFEKICGHHTTLKYTQTRPSIKNFMGFVALHN